MVEQCRIHANCLSLGSTSETVRQRLHLENSPPKFHYFFTQRPTYRSTFTNIKTTVTDPYTFIFCNSKTQLLKNFEPHVTWAKECDYEAGVVCWLQRRTRGRRPS